jgi:hypothetical protein
MRKENLIIVILMLFLSQNSALAVSGMEMSSYFILDYADFFDTPPNYVIYNGKILDMSQIYYMSLGNVVEEEREEREEEQEEEYSINNIGPPIERVSAKENCSISRIQALSAAKKVREFIHDNKILPSNIQIGNCTIGNADFMIILAKVITSSNSTYLLTPTYFDEIITWNSPVEDKFIEYTLDYESDRPTYSGQYLQDKKIAAQNTDTIAFNPKSLKKICIDGYCTLPDDYGTKNYSSSQVAWPTAIIKDNKVLVPGCYPFCSVERATPVLIGKFMKRYGIALNWHMTGDSIIALAGNKSLLNQVKRLNGDGLLSLGLQTMYHSSLKMISRQEKIDSLSENYNVFRHFFGKDPVQFRAPYQQLPGNYSAAFLEKFGIIADNEGSLACLGCKDGNYEKYEDSDILYARIDTDISTEDDLINFYPYHPWELVFEEIGDPAYLVESTSNEEGIIKQWLFFIGELGYTPITVEKYLIK